MVKQEIQGVEIRYQFLGSIGGLFLILLLTVITPKTILEFPFRKPLIGLIISVISILGIIAVFLPNKCSKIFNPKNNSYQISLKSSTSQNLSYYIRGHHPSCGMFSAHIFQLRGKKICLACFGLFIGGLIALPMGIGYFFLDFPIYENGIFVVIIGTIFVFFGLFHFKFNRLLRFIFNTTFVLGSMITLIGIDYLIESIFIDLLIISLIIFWLFTRIIFSKWNHENICFKCKIKKCTIIDKKRN